MALRWAVFLPDYSAGILVIGAVCRSALRARGRIVCLEVAALMLVSQGALLPDTEDFFPVHGVGGFVFRPWRGQARRRICGWLEPFSSPSSELSHPDRELIKEYIHGRQPGRHRGCRHSGPRWRAEIDRSTPRGCRSRTSDCRIQDRFKPPVRFQMPASVLVRIDLELDARCRGIVSS